jgi:hypothetical protein
VGTKILTMSVTLVPQWYEIFKNIGSCTEEYITVIFLGTEEDNKTEECFPFSYSATTTWPFMDFNDS